jgi:hypothetical protein
MEAKELRIGNYILFETKLINETSTIVGYNNDLTNIKYLSDKSDNYYSLGCSIRSKYLKPIPLTEEWLLRFGFDKKDNSSYWRPNKCWHRYVFGYTKFGLPYLNLEPEGCIGPHATCYYVHQLQNLYFALTNKELKTNKL